MAGALLLRAPRSTRLDSRAVILRAGEKQSTTISNSLSGARGGGDARTDENGGRSALAIIRPSKKSRDGA